MHHVIQALHAVIVLLFMILIGIPLSRSLRGLRSSIRTRMERPYSTRIRDDDLS